MAGASPTVAVEIVSRWDAARVLFRAEIDASIPIVGRISAALQIAVGSGADLRGANLRDADLRGAKGATIERTSPLALLRHQPGTIRAFKVLDTGGQGHIQGGLTYARDVQAEVPDADTSEHELCGAGIHLATLDWCLREWRPSLIIAAFDFTASDIASIPLGTDGKFRVFRATRREDLPQHEIDRMLGREPAPAALTEDAA